MHSSRDHIREPEQMPEPVDAVKELFIGPDRECQIGDRGRVRVALTMQAPGGLAGENAL